MNSPSGRPSQSSLNEGQWIPEKKLSPKMLKGFRLLFYLGCATSILLVMVVGIVSYEALNRQQKLEKWVEHTYNVLRKTDSINMYFNQTLLPGNYMSTPDRATAAWFKISERENLKRQISNLTALVKDNSLQLHDIDLLSRQIDSLGSYANKDSRQLRSEISKIKASLTRIKQDEEALLFDRENAYKLSGRQTQIIVVIGSLLILLIVSWLIYVILTELKNRIRAYQEEHELNQLKSSFVTLASHEFRTPLSSVLLSATLIERYMQRDEKEQVMKHVTKIKQVVHSLECILEDFLSLEKLEEGLVRAEFTYFDLVAVCEEIIAAYNVMAKARQQLIYVLPTKPQVVKLDRTLIEKSVSGLLSNAIKYAGDEACIWLKTEVTPNRVVISVKDNGVGIADEDQKKLSTIFYRVNNTGQIAGAGLGLNIVKRYVHLMNGSLEFSSVPYEETCFTMTFPVTQ
ncbi:ATP-binding protein [Mucilaginibacter ximonensis]|uniref:histidine kinase n=1 Tax=Mucilaginibacter ximonensis TaxID=538021 RepID=A0ABW5YD92_9SPHI